MRLSYGSILSVFCPHSFQVQTVDTNCQQVCNQVWAKAGSEYNDMYSIGPTSFGISNGMTYFPNICTCVFLKKNTGTVNKALYCTYNAKPSEAVSNSIDELINNDINNAPSDIPSNLVRMFIFSQKGNFNFSSLSSGGDALFSGMYTVYTFAIKDITTMFALLLVMIITGWAFGLYVLENLMNVLKAGNPARLENMISVDLKKKAKQVLIAVIVFGLPVPTNNFILKSAGIGMSSAGQQALSYDKCQSGIINPSSAGQDYCNVNTANACQACQSALAIIPQNCKQINEIQQTLNQANTNGTNYQQTYQQQEQNYQQAFENSVNNVDNSEADNNSSSSNYASELQQAEQQETPKESAQASIQKAGQAQIQTLVAKNYNAIVAYNTCTQNYIQMNQDINNQSNSNQYPSFLKETPEDVHLPLAVAIVDGFINTGLSYAKTVSNYTSNVIENYIIQTMLSKGTGMLTPNRSAEIQKLNAMRQELQDKEFISVNNADCSVFDHITNCTQFRSLSSYTIAKAKEKQGGCGILYDAIASYCNTLSPGDLVSRIGTLDEDIDKAKSKQETILPEMNESLGNIMHSMTWLSPAILPLTAIYLQVAKFANFDYHPPRTDITYQDGGGITVASNVANYGIFHWVVTGVVHGYHEIKRGIEKRGVGGETVHLIKEVITPPGAKDVSGIADATGTVGWQLLTGGHADSRAYYFGRIIGLTSIPPGSIVKSTLSDSLPSGEIPVLRKIPGISAIADGITAFYSVAKNVVVTLFAYVLTTLFIKAIPILAVSIPVIFRFLAYLKDLMKFMLTLPFFAVGAATRDAGSALEAFRELVKLTLMPMVIAFAPLVGFTAVELTKYFAYELPTAMMFDAIKTMTTNSFIMMFTAGYFTSILYAVTTFLSAVVGWEISLAFIDGIFEMAQRLSGQIASASSRAISSAIAMLRPNKP